MHLCDCHGRKWNPTVSLKPHRHKSHKKKHHKKKHHKKKHTATELEDINTSPARKSSTVENATKSQTILEYRRNENRAGNYRNKKDSVAQVQLGIQLLLRKTKMLQSLSMLLSTR